MQAVTAVVGFADRRVGRTPRFVTPQTISVSMPRIAKSACKSVGEKTRPWPGLSTTVFRPQAGASAAMMSWPGSPRIRMRPIGPGAPIRSKGEPRSILAGGGVGKIGAMPLARMNNQHAEDGRAAREQRLAGTHRKPRARETFIAQRFPRIRPVQESPAACSMITSAVAFGSIAIGTGLGNRPSQYALVLVNAPPGDAGRVSLNFMHPSQKNRPMGVTLAARSATLSIQCVSRRSPVMQAQTHDCAARQKECMRARWCGCGPALSCAFGQCYPEQQANPRL